MNMYMTTQTRQILTKDILGNEKWVDDTKSNHTFFIFATNEKEANEYAESAIAKVNEYAARNERYIMATEPKQVNVMYVTHDINNGTSVAGIWN